MWIVVFRLCAFLGLLAADAILLACLYSAVKFSLSGLRLLLMGRDLRTTRRESQSQLRLIYEESMEPAVEAVNLLK